MHTGRPEQSGILRASACVAMGWALGACGDAKNSNFDLSLEDSIKVTEYDTVTQESGCNSESDVGCGAFQFSTSTGLSIDQGDAFSTCSATAAGDLHVTISSSSFPTAATTAQFRVHQNTAPTGFAYCEGIKSDEDSETGFARNSCDMQLLVGGDTFAATAFERCLVVIDSTTPLRGSASCPILRSGKKAAFVEKIAFHCEVPNSGGGT